jgi:hypothetical protein
MRQLGAAPDPEARRNMDRPGGIGHAGLLIQW